MDSFADFLVTTANQYKVDEISKLKVDPGNSQQCIEDVQLLTYMLRIKKPKKILEVGVHRGGGTIHLFNEVPQSSTIYSVDILETIPTKADDPIIPIGDLAEKYYRPEIHPNWIKFYGHSASECMESIGTGIDFVVLDAAHCLPGEVLDYLAILPFIEDKAVILIHDLFQHWADIAMLSRNDGNYATPLLFHAIFSKNKYVNHDTYPWFGAVVIDKKIAIQYINHVVNLLCLPWKYLPGEKTLENARKIIKSNYSYEIQSIFELSASFNTYNIKTSSYISIDSLPLATSICSTEKLHWHDHDDLNSVFFDASNDISFLKTLAQVSTTEFAPSLRNWPGRFLFPVYSPAFGITENEYALRIEIARCLPLLVRNGIDIKNFLLDRNDLLNINELRRYFYKELGSLLQKELEENIKKAASRDVYFWGYGNAYEQYKNLFQASRPKAILINIAPQSGLPKSIDGIPVKFASQVLPDSVILPIVVFAREAHISKIVRHIEKEYPDFGGDNVIIGSVRN